MLHIGGTAVVCPDAPTILADLAGLLVLRNGRSLRYINKCPLIALYQASVSPNYSTPQSILISIDASLIFLYIQRFHTRHILDMASSLKADYRPQGNNDTQRRRMAIDSVLNPDDSSTGAKNHPSRESSIGDDSRGSSSPASSVEYGGVPRSHEVHQSFRSSSHRRERREMRPTYQQEEEYFIWYHRVDLGMDWRDVREAYNAQFPHRQRRGFQGIQCKYYRCCETHGIPRVRERNRAASPDKSYGVRNRLPGLWYPWMRSQHRGNASSLGILECAVAND